MKRDNLLFGMLRFLILAGMVAVALLFINKYAAKFNEYGLRVFKEQAVTDPETGDGKSITITIGEEVSPRTLGELLEAKGLIRDKWLFVLQYYCSEYRKEIKAGTYVLRSTMTAEDMFAVMAGHEEGDE